MLREVWGNYFGLSRLEFRKTTDGRDRKSVFEMRWICRKWILMTESIYAFSGGWVVETGKILMVTSYISFVFRHMSFS